MFVFKVFDFIIVLTMHVALKRGRLDLYYSPIVVYSINCTLLV